MRLLSCRHPYRSKRAPPTPAGQTSGRQREAMKYPEACFSISSFAQRWWRGQGAQHSVRDQCPFQAAQICGSVAERIFFESTAGSGGVLPVGGTVEALLPGSGADGTLGGFGFVLGFVAGNWSWNAGGEMPGVGVDVCPDVASAWAIRVGASSKNNPRIKGSVKNEQTLRRGVIRVAGLSAPM